MAVRVKITLDIQNAILDNVFKKEISALYFFLGSIKVCLYLMPPNRLTKG